MESMYMGGKKQIFDTLKYLFLIYQPTEQMSSELSHDIEDAIVLEILHEKYDI